MVSVVPARLTTTRARALDGAGKVHIGYYDSTNKDLKYVARCPK